MVENKFTEEDLNKYVEALNFIAKQAKFSDGPISVAYAIETRNHFAFLQSMVAKINANILEIKSVKHKDKK